MLCRVLPISPTDDPDRFRRGEDMRMSRSRVVRMAMGNQSAFNGKRGVDSVDRPYI